ncbi:hypothetical protein CM49_06384 [Paenibacillus sp. P1XP2]|jgi:hypothetical protein|nr:hypothetical protein CM49_06384 [Paenibacillus sp. P1XP2]
MEGDPSPKLNANEHNRIELKSACRRREVFAFVYRGFLF